MVENKYYFMTNENRMNSNSKAREQSFIETKPYLIYLYIVYSCFLVTRAELN